MALHVAEGPFVGLEQRLKDRVSNALLRRTYEKGDHLYSAGEDFAGLFWLRSGVALSYNMHGGKRYEFAAPVYWGLWGAPAMLARTHNSALEARTRCVVDWLPPSETSALVDEPDFVKLVAKWTADDYAMLLELLAVISMNRSDDRLIGFLRRVYEVARANPDHGVRAPTETGIAWPFTTVELAAFLSLSRPHVSTILSRLSAEGKVRIEGRTLYMPDTAGDKDRRPGVNLRAER